MAPERQVRVFVSRTQKENVKKQGGKRTLEIKRIVYAESGRRSNHNGPLLFRVMAFALLLEVDRIAMAYDALNSNDLLEDGDLVFVAVDDVRGVEFARRHSSSYPLIGFVARTLIPAAKAFPAQMLWVERAANHEKVPNLRELFEQALEAMKVAKQAVA